MMKQSTLPRLVLYLVVILGVVGVLKYQSYTHQADVTRRYAAIEGRIARSVINLPPEADVVQVFGVAQLQDAHYVVFRLPPTKSVQAWLDYVCAHNTIRGHTWKTDPDQTRVMLNGWVTVRYDIAHHWYRCFWAPNYGPK
ncbi:MAG: hypothetical protein ACLQVD_17205 [Capsulimonadaceae bacterium]